MITIHQTESPEAELDARVNDFAAGGRDSDGFALEYAFAQYYLPEAPELELVALVVMRRAEQGLKVAVSITEKSDALLRGLNCVRSEWDLVKQWCDEHGLPWFELDRPVRLEAVHIPKPWGQEIWYTGIEARGQSRVVDDSGRALPLPWLLSVCPRHLLGGSREIVLLKILDPLPEPVLGDLYFEMHEEKREVYVITHVDQNAWPAGKGGIRFGFDQQKRAEASSDEAFKSDYLAAVNAYRAVRLQIDEYLDSYRREQGIALDAPLDPGTLRAWLADVPRELKEEEEVLREAMEAFVHVDPLQVGDVVKVPCYTPHSLLHGVRTVEFQTPVYERKILSFAQKVLTQSHWDTASALQDVSLDAPVAAELPRLMDEDGVRLEEVALFEDFRVERLRLGSGKQVEADSRPGNYTLVMAVAGDVRVNGSALLPEQAALIPAASPKTVLSNDSSSPVIALVARPRGR